MGSEHLGRQPLIAQLVPGATYPLNWLLFLLPMGSDDRIRPPFVHIQFIAADIMARIISLGCGRIVAGRTELTSGFASLLLRCSADFPGLVRSDNGMFATDVLTSLAEYEARTAASERLDYDDGDIIEIPNNDCLQNGITSRLVRQFIRQLPDPIDAASELTFELAPGRIRHPDVSVCLAPRPMVAGTRTKGAPDLAVEIVSRSESAQDLHNQDLHNKVRLYLENGAKAVWVVYPESMDIEIHQPNRPTRLIPSDGVIEGEEPIPAFRISVAELFA